MQAIADVLNNFLNTKAETSGKAKKTKTPDQLALFETLPAFFSSILATKNRSLEFKVQGSIGQGNIADVPWVAIFNKKVTTSAQNGYYIVLLFSKDMTSCYLSLNQGATFFERQYSRRLQFPKMSEVGQAALRHLAPIAPAVSGKINLAATGDLSKGYEHGAIVSYRYEANSLPSQQTVEQDFLTLLAHYDTLFAVAGESIHDLVEVNEATYQQAVIDRISTKKSGSKAKFVEPAGVVAAPKRRTLKGKSTVVRNPAVGEYALELASFKCEIDPMHATFVSGSSHVAYLEAHHLVPISLQPRFDPVSLDVSANVVALCPMCHKRLHHGRAEDKKKDLQVLLKNREARLREKGILIDRKTLLSYYKSDLLEEDA